MKAAQKCSSFGWNSFFMAADCQILAVNVVRGSLDSATVNCARLRIDLLLNIYVILMGQGLGGGGLRERGRCHGLVNHRYVLTYTKDLFG